jgi:hypothetical protein
MNYQEISKEEFEKVLKKLYAEYPSLLKAIHFNITEKESWCSNEMICGSISEKITDFLQKLGIQAHCIHGSYEGRGTEFSGGKDGTSHCWVELWIRWRDNDKEFKVIIDGAYAQFFPENLTPMVVRNAQRLTIFINDKKAEEWYKGKGETLLKNGKRW